MDDTSTAKAHDPFANMDENQFESTPPEAAENPVASKPPTIKAGGRSAFQPAESSGGDALGEMFEAFNEESIFDFVGDKFDQKMDDAPQSAVGGQKTFANTPRKTQIKQVVDPEDANFAAVMYVEGLEMCMIVLCEWIDKGAVPGGYKFKESLKQKHAEMASKLMVHENVYVSPMALFLVSGILLLGANVIKAFKNKKKIEKQLIYAEKSKKAVRMNTETGQTTMFDIDPIDLPRKNYKAVMIDNVAYYFWNTEKDAKAKKDELEEVPPELSKFLFDYYAAKQKWPDRKAVQTFLKYGSTN